jgi:hypothetical protein
MVIAVFVAQGEGVDPLLDQVCYCVLDSVRAR